MALFGTQKTCEPEWVCFGLGGGGRANKESEVDVRWDKLSKKTLWEE